jgi:hypothetical protein
VWRCVVRCGVVRCGDVRCGAVRCVAMRCDAVQCSGVQWGAVGCSGAQWDAVRCSMCVEEDWVGQIGKRWTRAPIQQMQHKLSFLGKFCCSSGSPSSFVDDGAVSEVDTDDSVNANAISKISIRCKILRN